MKLEFMEERDMDLMDAYKRVLRHYGKRAPFIKKSLLMLQTSKSPAKKFYVSEEQALRIVTRLYKGKDTYIKSREKVQMYHDILERVRDTIRPIDTLSLAIRRVIQQEAPRFYVTPETARIILYRLMNNRKR